MSRLTAIKRLAFASFGAAGLVVACRAASPGEAPPLAPRPDLGRPTNPVPGAPDPIRLPDLGAPPTENDAGVGAIPQAPMGGPVSSQVELRSSTPMQAPRDAGVVDATRPDASGPDAARADAARADAAPIDAATVAPRDGRVPDARDSGVTGLPPVLDAQLPVPGDAARPLR